jgi:hypothetical protein
MHKNVFHQGKGKKKGGADGMVSGKKKNQLVLNDTPSSGLFSILFTVLWLFNRRCFYEIFAVSCYYQVPIIQYGHNFVYCSGRTTVLSGSLLKGQATMCLLRALTRLVERTRYFEFPFFWPLTIAFVFCFLLHYI